MVFSKRIKTYFKFLSDAGFRKRKYHIVDSRSDETYVFKRKNVQLEVEFSLCVNVFDFPKTVEQIINSIDTSWHINLYLDIDDKHENIAFSEMFPNEELEALRTKLLAYEFKNVDRQLEIYAEFIERHLNDILAQVRG